ncbi:MAG: YdcF family protein [Pseudaminobacter sp.]|nr:YdcF family protein [Pseudaminobacter sp.]
MMKGQEAPDAMSATPDGVAPPAENRGKGLLAFLRIAGFASVAIAALFAGGFGIFASHVSSLETPADQAKADAIIVLTGGQARIDAALDLLQSGKGERLLISGVHPAAGRESLRKATGGDKKMFSCCVDIDHAALDTIGNAEESAKWVENHDYGSVILVTNNYHMPRSLLEMGRFLDRGALKPYPVVNTRLDDGGWMTEPDALRVLFTEYNKYLVALARGVVPVRRTTEGIAFVDASAADLRRQP